MDPSSPILIWQPGGGTPPGEIAVPKPPITNADLTQLVIGQSYIDVVFDIEQVDNTWIFLACEVLNTTDLDPLNIWPGIITVKTSTGFRLQLNGLPDSVNYFLNWAISGVNIPPPPPVVATTYTLTGPATGNISTPSTNFTVKLPAGGTVTGSVTVTPSDGGGGGTFVPTSVTLTTGASSATFTYTPASYGAITISATNSGGLADPGSLTYTVASATGYSMTGPSSGDAGVASTPFTVTLTPSGLGVSAPVTVTPSDGGGGGTFTPTTVSLSTGTPSATFTYTPASTGAKTISATNSGGLSNPANLTYTATVSLHLLNTLISYWKLDEAAGTAKADSQPAANNLSDPTSCPSFAAIIGNAPYFTGTNYLNRVSTSSLQVTGDFTFSLWTRIDVNTNEYVIYKGNSAGARDYYLGYFAGTGFQFGLGGAANAVVGANVPTLSAWYHVVAWYDSSDSKLRMRINDATTYVSTGTDTATQSTEPLVLGGFWDGAAMHGLMQGMIDEMGFWKRKLTAAEITQLYNGGSGLPFSSFTT